MPLKTTPLHSHHLQAGAHMAAFAGWDMPIHYGSQMDEHHQVRQSAGVFDVSHMAVVDIQGRDAEACLQKLLANDVGKLQEDGKGLYSCMLNETAGVIDDLIVYRRAAGSYRLILNAGTAGGDLEWITEQSNNFSLSVQHCSDLAILAVQGPLAREMVGKVTGHTAPVTALARFYSLELDDLFIARTGYTGEDGVEILLPADRAAAFWEQLVKAGAAPTGLGARDTLRLEAGYCLYGQDLDTEHTPLDSGLAWTIAWEPADREFMGRNALADKTPEQTSQFAGLLLKDKGVLRSGMTLLQNNLAVGKTTSGGFSPTLQRSIALARFNPGWAPSSVSASDTLFVDIRGKQKAVQIVPLPFVKNGKITAQIQGTSEKL